MNTSNNDRRPPTDWSLARRVWPYMVPAKRWLLVVAVVMPIGVLIELAQPILIKRAIDQGIEVGNHAVLLESAGLYAAAVIGAYIARTLANYGLTISSLRALAVIRRDVFRHVMRQGQAFFDQRTTGSLMTRTTNDVEAIYESLAWGAARLIADGLVIIGTIVMMLLLDWRLTLVSFALSPIIVVVVNYFRKRLRALFFQIRKSLSQLNGFFAEQINGMDIVQMNAGQPRARAEFRNLAHHYLRLFRQANWWDAGLYAIMDGMSALSIGLMLGCGAWFFGTPESGMTLGLMVAFIDYLTKVFVPIRDFSGNLASLQRATAALERITSLFDTHVRIGGGSHPLPRVQGHLTFENVSFRYRDDLPTILRDIKFSVQPGEVVALVGATGSGKTTVAKLLTRMYDGYDGTIRIDGHDVSTISPEKVRAQISVIAQDAYFFDGTVAENITLWHPELSIDDVKDAARLACAHDFIVQLDGGYEAQIKTRGSNLSSGQRQLLGIARALIRRSPIVVMDEATANVDSQTEHLIDQAVGELLKHHTVLVIAHRLSTIAKADRILVMSQGAIVEQGSHTELMALGGHYHLLVETGFNV
ncbi:MAG: ABC transporter ATP-binding protein [Myxococcota bacterium]|nr:ABC transporter ATP-binding protein [Myxococcota bacterium]